MYGSAYGDNWASKLWMVYAKADSRWGQADLTVISLELLTVFGAGPLALYICYAISKRNPMVGFWMVVLATGELYGGLFFLSSSPLSPFNLLYFGLAVVMWGLVLMYMKTGFMTFCPEWLTGNQNLDASNFMFKWVYLVFFNMLWVFLPLYAMWYSFGDMYNAFMVRNELVIARLEMERKKAEGKSK